MSTDKSQAHTFRRSLIRSTSLLSVGTLFSRVLGFIRDILFARYIGTGMSADAFFVAFKIPNLFRSLVGEGAVNAALVPVFSQYKNEGDKASFGECLSSGLILFGGGLSILTILGVICSPLLVRIVAPGFMAEPEKLQLAISLTRWMFPYLFFIGLMSYFMGILYTYRSFVVPAFSSCLLNISIIISIVISAKSMGEPIWGLVFGVLIGGICQFAVHLLPLKKNKIVFVKPKVMIHPGAKKIGALLVPRIFGAGVYQLNVLIDTFCASLSSLVGGGGVSAIYYANRIVQFPIGIFGVALASAALPDLSQHFVNKDELAFKRIVCFSLKNMIFVMVPCTVMLLLFARPVIQLLFERGAFTSYSTDITSSTLWFYSFGLCAFACNKLLVTAFHALQDTKTPVKIAGVCLVLNAALNFILMGPLKIGGIALASSIAGFVNFSILFVFLARRVNGLGEGLLLYCVKVCCAGLFSGAILYFSFSLLAVSLWIQIFVGGGCGFVLYGAFCLFFKVESAQKIMQSIFK
ncbi:murein biosynthesis integral membrane protein MurJ [Candidatus Omnitrophota bacterium]